MKLQYCAKVMQANFAEFPGFSGLFEEISLEAKFPRTFEGPIVSMRPKFRRKIRCDANESRNFERNFALLESSLRNFDEISLGLYRKCSHTTSSEIRGLFLCNAAQKTSEISFINSIDFSILLTLSLK